ncbi:hypothetical protein Nepgr_006036 [Nepenthes gracilis]|uniref:Protein kinase domain-containing protein n=1 Tax=Nepenthes gracilis TaxID=150966 RepID=A0AAD3XH03_NEPGR|nr:hypothetical protein Nepgr_006036 [Nepenthes gracilis]
MDVETVLDFLRKNGFSEAELAFKDDIRDKRQIGPFDFEKFTFRMNAPLPPVKVPASFRRRRVDGLNCDGGSGGDCSENEEFVSLGSSTSGVCSSEFTNPYGRRSAIQADSETSSDRLSQFGTARDYHDFDMQTDLWNDEKDEGYYLTPVGGFDPSGGSSQDKFVMTSDIEKQSKIPFDFNNISKGFESEDSLEDQFQFCRTSTDNDNYGQAQDTYNMDIKLIHPDQGIKWNLGVRTDYSNLEPICKCCAGSEALDHDDSLDLKAAVVNEFQLGIIGKPIDNDPASNGIEKHPSGCSNGKGQTNRLPADETTCVATEEEFLQDNNYDCEVGGDKEVIKGSQGPSAVADDEESAAVDELPFWETNEDEYEVFNLRIIHRKNRTGFEESKDLPIVLNTIMAGRYYITEYLGSAAFSKVVQAHDIHTGVDVCLKIIKNDKDFFDQSLDEIKLLKYVNKHDPADKRHILRLYDYFYYQEHLFIVCELLRANLYEFQKFNLESGGEPYFTLSRLQVITRQCLEALDFLHQLGIIHCDLKPENILFKSYSRCEIKVIDLGSSCFQTDNLCLYVQSRSYRAPEVILGLPYDPKIDIWSLGCILAELCSGEVLFPNDGVVMMLARMIGLLGPIDKEMLLRGKETYKYFTEQHDLYRIHEETNQVEYIDPELSSLEHLLSVSDVGFVSFIKFLLQTNPRRRPTAKDALRHPWISQPYDF